MVKTALFVLLWLLSPFATAQDTYLENALQTQLALDKLNVLGSVLYVGAHPDDENTGLLAYLAKEKKYRAAYLSITRGEGGQNLIGTEKGIDIGILRTQELLSARKIDACEQYFTRAIDFGFSKSVKESLNFWGREKTLADVVWVIRSFQPDVILLRFPTNEGSGHGHHPAGSILALEAFAVANDPKRFPEQLQYVKPWQTKRIFINQGRWGGASVEGLHSIDVGHYDPSRGFSYNELAAKIRSMHKSQGFGSLPSSGSQLDYFRLLAGEPIEKDIMEGVDTSWNRLKNGGEIGQLIEGTIASFDIKAPAKSLSRLLEIYERMNALENVPWVEVKKDELLRIIKACAGIRFETFAEDYTASPKDNLNITVNFIQRMGIQSRIESITFPSLDQRFEINRNVLDNALQSIRQTITIPADHPISHPYWLLLPEEKGSFNVANQQLIGRAENLPTLPVELEITILGKKILLTTHLRYRWVERDNGEMQRPFEVRPPVTANFKQSVAVFHPSEKKEITLTLKNHASSSKGAISLKVPTGWQVYPESIRFDFSKRHDEKPISFIVHPPTGAITTELSAVVSINDKHYSYSFNEIIYPHIDSRVRFTSATQRLIPMNIKGQKRIGYIMGSGDDLPEILKDMGYDVALLDDDMLNPETLAGFNVVVAGIRAYNTRQRLKFVQPILMDFVKKGGTYVVQYNVNSGLQVQDLGPYPFNIGRSRIVEEDATMRFLAPSHSIMNNPNPITKDDFSDWVQERGLYFPEQWDQNYIPIFAGNDEGEAELPGSTLYCNYGDGVYIYTSLAFFRQLPAGIPGAFNLFQNLIESKKR
ncbi:MAG: PIG-L family deacetylase [Holophagaceae bacterium]|nr:PIG-L family deacetylase [Holophagaceae bacterium]